MAGPRFKSESVKEFVLYATCVERTYTSWPRLSIARGGKKNVCLLPPSKHSFWGAEISTYNRPYTPYMPTPFYTTCNRQMTAHSRKVALFGCSLIQSIVTQIHTCYTANHRLLGEKPQMD